MSGGMELCQGGWSCVRGDGVVSGGVEIDFNESQAIELS